MVLMSDGGGGGGGVGPYAGAGGSTASSTAGSMRGNPMQAATRARGRMSKAFSLSLPAARDPQQSFYSPSRFSTLSGDDLATFAAARVAGGAGGSGGFYVPQGAIGTLPYEPLSLTDSFTRVVTPMNGIQNSLTAPDFGASLEFDADQVIDSIHLRPPCRGLCLHVLNFNVQRRFS